MSGEGKFFTLVGIITIVILGIGIFFYTRGTTTQGTKVDSALLIKENSTKITSASASATFVEFGDLQCPACAQVHPAVSQLRHDLTGKVNFVFRHFPLPQHANAQIAAETAEAANSQGKFWEMQDMMYENQKDWEESKQPLDVFLGYAKQLNLDTEKIKKEVEDNKYKDKIDGDAYDGNQAGVDATPTFFINGVKYEGTYSYDEMKKVLLAPEKK
jgi:protein-disulfide isomerase